MTMIGSPACPLGRLEGQARGGGEGEGRCRLSSPPPKGATPCDRPPRGAILIPRPLGVVDYWRAGCGQSRTSGSEGGRRKRADLIGTSPAAYPTCSPGCPPPPATRGHRPFVLLQ